MCDLPGPAEFGVVFPHLVFARDVEEFFNGPILDAADSLGSDLKPPLLIAIDIALLDQLLHQIRMFLFPLIQVVENKLAMIEHVAAEFIKQLVRGLRSKLLRTIPPRVFEIRHPSFILQVSLSSVPDSSSLTMF